MSFTRPEITLTNDSFNERMYQAKRNCLLLFALRTGEYIFFTFAAIKGNA